MKKDLNEFKSKYSDLIEVEKNWPIISSSCIALFKIVFAHSCGSEFRLPSRPPVLGTLPPPHQRAMV